MSSSNRLARPAVSWGIAGAFASAVLLVAASAAADASFPERLAKDLSMPCTPPCTICHVDTKGGFGTLRNIASGKPGFGKTLHQPEFGLVVSDFNTLETALQADEAAKSDVDGDGTPDIEELKKCEDPNDPTPGASLLATGPEFGCVRVAKPGPVDGVASVAAAAVLVLGAAALRRRRAR
jgi:MYXO-CTERM domain-containing protein